MPRSNQALQTLELGQGNPPAKFSEPIVAPTLVVEAGLGTFTRSFARLPLTVDEPDEARGSME